MVTDGESSTGIAREIGEAGMMPPLAVRREMGGVADHCTGISENDLESSKSRQLSLL